MAIVYFVLILCLGITLHKTINFYGEQPGRSLKREETKNIYSSRSIPSRVSVDKAIFIPVIQKIIVLPVPSQD